eukprot:scaffold199440_cov26-Prasinocladus_malaysianus.AAC.1
MEYYVLPSIAVAPRLMRHRPEADWHGGALKAAICDIKDDKLASAEAEKMTTFISPAVQKCDIAVIGGGPGGLAAALAAKKARPSATVKVFEAADAYKQQGAGVMININGWYPTAS